MIGLQASEWRVYLAITALTLLAGCSGNANHAADPVQPGAPAATPVVSAPSTPLFALPAPDMLLAKLAPGTTSAKARRVSYIESDLLQNGDAFLPGLPRNRESAGALGAELSPDWTNSSASTFDDLAYVTYDFIVSGYDRNAQVRLDWNTPPADFHQSWIALANWTRNRWDWYKGTADGKVNMSSLAPYFDATNNLLCVVLRTGTDMSILASIRLGTPGPTPSFTITPVIGSAPLNVTLDASATTPGEGTISKYEWDLDGDGTFETDGGTTATYNTTYSDSAQHLISLRATNSSGVSATSSGTCDSIAPWQHTWGQSNNEQISAVTADESGEIYSAGYTRAPSGPFNDDIVVSKWSPQGLQLWSQKWDGGPSDYSMHIKTDADGNVIMAGVTDASGDRQLLVQKWDPAGTLLWSKTFGSVGFDSPCGLVLNSTDIYIGGDTNDSGVNSDLFACQLNTSGALLWSQARDHGDTDSGTDLAPLQFMAGVSGISVVGDAYASGVPNIWRVNYGTDGTFNGGYEFGTAAEPKRQGHLYVYYEFTSFTYKYYLTGIRDGGSGYQMFLSCNDEAGASIFGTRWWNTGAPVVTGLTFDLAGNLVVAGYIPGFAAGSFYGMLWKFDSASGNYVTSEYLNNGDIQTRFYSIEQYYNGFLVSGYCQDASGTWGTLTGSSGTFGDTWSGFDGTGGGLGWSESDTPGTVSDLAAIGVFDTGAGLDDGLVLYHGSPGA